MAQHYTCPAVVFLCIDWRLHPDADNYFREKFGSFDPPTTAGGIKDFFAEDGGEGYLVSQLVKSILLHDPEEIVLTIHTDCGAYGGSKAFDSREDELAHHRRELARTAALILEKYPAKHISTYILDLAPAESGWHTRAIPVTTEMPASI
ncbi:MAG: hypothetical protein Q8R39_02085 [bacterium]|nr:hypothetical protein [bacterium]MDZ4284728.1 hypothetical protein [Patescibacteria group bacterium]